MPLAVKPRNGGVQGRGDDVWCGVVCAQLIDPFPWQLPTPASAPRGTAIVLHSWETIHGLDLAHCVENAFDILLCGPLEAQSP
jgi:hypothetical protein